MNRRLHGILATGPWRAGVSVCISIVRDQDSCAACYEDVIDRWPARRLRRQFDDATLQPPCFSARPPRPMYRHRCLTARLCRRALGGSARNGRRTSRSPQLYRAAPASWSSGGGSGVGHLDAQLAEQKRIHAIANRRAHEGVAK